MLLRSSCFLIRLAFLAGLALILDSVAARAQDLATLHQQKADAFRNIFYSYAKTRYGDADIQKLIFTPSPLLLQSGPAIEAGADALQARRDAWNALKPSDLYSAGVSAPFTAIDGLDDNLAQNPVTIFIIPGIFGEFIDNNPFQEVLSLTDSVFAKQWAAALAGTTAEKTDPVYDTETLATSDKPLDQITIAASIDDAAGRALIRVIYLKPLLGSLETLGTLDESSALYLRRMTKIWNIIGPQPNSYLLGYSRGLNVALDVVAKADADPQHYPWIDAIKGIVSLGGTAYGSALADAAMIEGQTSHAAIKIFDDLAQSLTSVPSDASVGDKIKVVADNAGRWAKASAQLLAVSATIKTPEGLKLENIKTDDPDIGAFGRLIKTIAFDKFKVLTGTEYAQNVEKFKVVVKKAMDGIHTLTEEGATAWLKTHTIPARLHYYVIQGTMGDPTTQDRPSLLATDSVSFNTKTLDYAQLRQSYYDYIDFQGAAVNDSQTSPDRTIFWPAAHRQLNPNQPDFDGQIIAMLGTDHWGMSFPVALHSEDDEVSPYPRGILLHSLGAFLSQDGAPASR